MERLKSDWTVELAEYMDEKYGIDINEGICDEVLKEIRGDENQKDKKHHYQ